MSLRLPPHGAIIGDDDWNRIVKGLVPICSGCYFDRKKERLIDNLSEVKDFFDPSQFPFAASIELHWSVIRDEFLALLLNRFEPWVQGHMHDGGWSVYGLFAMGEFIRDAAERCPRTAAVLATIPGLSMAGFSRLAPGAHVTPHVGWAKSVYRLHLGLVVPPGCRLRVGTTTRSWEEGRCMVFDDTIEHEAWNDSSQPRTVLLLDFLRPDIEGDVRDYVPEEVRKYADRLFNAK